MKWVQLLVLQLLLTIVVALNPMVLAGAQAQPHISLQPDMIPAGGQTTVSGAGFCGDAACSSITILLDGAVAVSGVPVGADGTFTVGIKPISTPGRRIVAATQDTPGGRISADAALNLTLADLTTFTASPGPTATATPSSSSTATPTSTTSPSATSTSPGSASRSPSATSLPAHQDDSGGGLPRWGWVLIGAGVSAAVAGAVLLTRRAHR